MLKSSWRRENPPSVVVSQLHWDGNKNHSFCPDVFKYFRLLPTSPYRNVENVPNKGWIQFLHVARQVAVVLGVTHVRWNWSQSIGKSRCFNFCNWNSISRCQTSCNIGERILVSRIDLFINGDFCMETKLVCFLVSEYLFLTTKLTWYHFWHFFFYFIFSSFSFFYFHFFFGILGLVFKGSFTVRFRIWIILLFRDFSKDKT